MSQRIWTKYFPNNFGGVNAETSAIDPDSGQVSTASNLEWALSNNLRGRTGCQLQTIQGGFFGLHSHGWSRTQDQHTPSYITYSSGAGTMSINTVGADGSSVQDLFVLNTDCYILDSKQLTFTYTGSNGTTWVAVVPNADLTQPGEVHFYFAIDDVLKLDFDCGIGLGTKTIYDLVTAINGISGCSMSTARTFSPFAQINGNQTAVAGATHPLGAPFTITVKAGHTYYAGDIITWNSAASTFNLGQFTTIQQQNMWVSGYVISTTATTITFVANNFVPKFTDNQILGDYALPASAIRIEQGALKTGYELSGSSPHAFTIDVLRPILGVPQPMEQATATITGGKSPNYRPPSFVSANGCIYFNAFGLYAPTYQPPLMKYDGNSVYPAGLPKAVFSGSITSKAGGSLTTNSTYRYKYYWKRIDAQGNIIEGTPSDISSVSMGGNQTTTYTVPYLTHTTRTATITFPYNAANAAVMKNGGDLSYTSGTWIPISTNTSTIVMPTLRVGDPVVFKTKAGALVRSYVTNIDGEPLSHSPITSPARMKIADTGTYTLGDGTVFSAGLTFVTLRTAANGTVFYQLDENPNNPFTATATIDDALADTTLVQYSQFIDAPIGKEHDAPPTGTLICEHQGGLCVSGIPSQPNSVFFSTASGIEYFPLASNNFDLPPTQPGAITAIASDTVDRLAVFKEHAYYDVVGDLDGGYFTVQTKTEGDYGVTSHATLKRVRGGLIGLSKLGFVSISNGQLLDQPFRIINARIINQGWFLQGAVGINDSLTRTYLCTIPETGNFDSLSHSYVLDYSREQTIPLDRDYNINVAPTSGFGIVDDELYYMNFYNGALFRRFNRFIDSISPRVDGDCYVDHVWPINYVYESQPINFEDPSLYKMPIRVRAYSIPNDNVADGWVPFTFLFQSAAFPNNSFLGSAHPGGITTELDFLDKNTWTRDVKLSGAKLNFLIVRLTVNKIKQSPFLSGYEIVVTAPYNKEDIYK